MIALKVVRLSIEGGPGLDERSGGRPRLTCSRHACTQQPPLCSRDEWWSFVRAFRAEGVDALRCGPLLPRRVDGPVLEHVPNRLERLARCGQQVLRDSGPRTRARAGTSPC